ncbi:cytochrome P450 [Pseudonocardia sp. HH130630-07]|uniref:cytochrome P450 n=1 Tax=Pseudonocardia sp. HH130630-07 TaxID=1690815 RepID=UPI000814E0E6|nr:cytochrome P450 [Pseudonocardia sp. HH130630-07]ANY05295.1 hypothetical protein AFB00_02060 [Pseudonocardia sp. HH130630-07]
MSTDTVEDVIEFDARYHADPVRFWAELRRTGRVHRARTPDGAPVWLVVGYEDCRALAADPRLSVDKRHATDGYVGLSLPPALDRNLLNMDGPDHVRLRRLLSAGFSPRRVAGMRPRITAIAEELASGLATTLVAEASCDLVGTYAAPLSVRVIAELLGVPWDRSLQFREWTTEVLAPADRHSAARAAGHLHRFLIEMVDRSRAAPGDDVLGDLVRARDGSDALSEDELVSAAFLLLFAGFENVTYV